MFSIDTIDWRKSLQEPKYWLVALWASLATLHLTILDQTKQINQMSLGILFWLAIASLIWDRRNDLKLNSGVFSSVLGATLIAFVLLTTLSPAGYHVRIFPLVSGIGICLIASGIKRIHHYWQELFILSLLVLYPIVAGILKAIDLPLLTAKFSNFSLWVAGFNPYREGVFIILPTGRVEVYGACSGIDSIILMLYVAILFLFIVPLTRWQKVICISLAILLGFIANALRVSLLAVLVALSQKETFEYWHGDDGSLVFALISVASFGIFCWLAYVRQFTLMPDSEE